MALKLAAESFGDRLHRAYRQGREVHGFTYAEIAEKLRQFIDVSDQTLMRYEKLDELPAGIRQRQTIYLALIAFGFEPEDFGLTIEMARLGHLNMRVVRKALSPGKKRARVGMPCFVNSPLSGDLAAA